MRFSLLFLMYLSSFLWGCSNAQKDVVVQYKDKYLSRAGLLSLMPQDYSPSDSADIAQQIIQHWIEMEWRKDQSAHVELSVENEIQLEDYEQALKFQNWKNQLLSEKLDTLITNDQIQEWRMLSGDSLNKFSSSQIKEVILQSRKNNIISDFMSQSLQQAEKDGSIKRAGETK
jgi:hypothetical protein